MGNQLQHYVPRFSLRRFGHGKQDHVHVMDKQSGRKFSFSASKKALISVAAEYVVGDNYPGRRVEHPPGPDPAHRRSLCAQRGRG